MRTKSIAKRFIRAIVGVALLLALLASSATPSAAWGSRTYTAPWGCKAYMESFVATHRNSRTHRQSSSSCSDMYARLRTSSGGGGTWDVDPWLAAAQSTNTAYVGGQHKVCGGCTVFST